MLKLPFITMCFAAFAFTACVVVAPKKPPRTSARRAPAAQAAPAASNTPPGHEKSPAKGGTPPGHDKAPAKGGTPPGQAKKADSDEADAPQSKGKSKGKKK